MLIKRKNIIVFMLVILIAWLPMFLANWDNTLPADDSVWNDAAGEIRDNWDAMEAIWGADLVGASPKFNVETYGATGDGSTDDTSAIQSALTAGAGAIVFFPEPASSYIISAQLNVSAGTRLEGPGAESTTIFLKASSNATMFSVSQADGVVITGLEINGNKANQGTSTALIVISQSDHCEVSFCRLLNAGLQAIAISGGTSATTNYNHIHHNYVDTTDSQGIRVSAENADATHLVAGNTIEFNYVTNTGYHGLEAKHPFCVDTVIHGNTLNTCTSGILADKGVNRVVISNNIVVDTQASGNLAAIMVTDGGTGTKSKDVIIIGNIIVPDTSVDIPAISVRTATRVKIADNIILADTGNTSAGSIFVLGSDDDEIMISGNIIESTGTIGINANASGVSNLTITDNYVGVSGSRGIKVTSRAIITNNTVHNADKSGIFLQDADFSIVSNNISYNNEQSGTNRGGIELNSTDNCVITNNVLFDNQGTATQSYGIVTVNASTNNLIKNNIFNSNVLGTVLLSGINQTDESLGVVTLANEATPTVGGGSVFVTGGTTTITDFDDGYTGKVIIIMGSHTVTITDGTHIILDGGASMSMTAGDTLMLVQKADTYWYQISESDNN